MKEPSITRTGVAELPALGCKFEGVIRMVNSRTIAEKMKAKGLIKPVAGTLNHYDVHEVRMAWRRVVDQGIEL